MVSQSKKILNAYSIYRSKNSPSVKVTSSKPTTSVKVHPDLTGTKLQKMQQELSNKYGIATFDTKGNISTVPTVARSEIKPQLDRSSSDVVIIIDPRTPTRQDPTKPTENIVDKVSSFATNHQTILIVGAIVLVVLMLAKGGRRR